MAGGWMVDLLAAALHLRECAKRARAKEWLKRLTTG